MDKIYEDKLALHRRIENIIKNIEENEAKANEAMEAIRQKSQTNKTSFGPANDLLRYLYVLEQQYQSDSPQVRTKAREDLYEYVNQFRPSVDNADEDDEDEQQPEQLDDPQQPDITIPSTTQPPVSVIQQPPAMPLPSQPTPIVQQQPPAMPLASQPTPIVQPSPAMSLPPKNASVLPLPSQAESVDKTLALENAPATSPDSIIPRALDKYVEAYLEAQKYEKLYKTIDLPRKKQLASRIKDIMNKLRKETLKSLTDELFQFLNGQEQTVANQKIRVTNNEERLLCLSMLASLTLNQLLGGDLNDIKTEIFLPLISKLSEHPDHNEFSIIFLERLYKRCPYTIPCYPERKPHMTDKEYLEKMGYNEKPEGNQRRLETETEFLNRMSGLIRLFCKLLVRGGPPFDADLSTAWEWCVDVANLPPRSNISSVLLRVFLDEAGEKMMQGYPTQFPKIIKYIQLKYLPKLEQVTSDDQIARFRLTFETFTNRS